MLANFRINAGLTPKAPVYGGWESVEPWIEIRSRWGGRFRPPTLLEQASRQQIPAAPRPVVEKSLDAARTSAFATVLLLFLFCANLLDGATLSGSVRLVDSRASYGISLQTFALGFPVHFDWSWRTLFNRDWEDIVFSQSGGSEAFRKPKFTMWIGYDF